MSKELTQEWLDLFNEDKTNGTLSQSIFWRLAKMGQLPLGVDESDERVQEALKEINRVCIGCGDPE